MSANSTDIAAFVAAAWDRHAEQPRELAAELMARAASLGSDGAGAIGLAEHVWIAHLHDGRGLQGFLDALPAAVLDTAPTRDGVRRARWVLAAAAGRDGETLPDALRWRGMQNLWSLWSADGRAAQALAMLRAEAPRALAHPEADARRALAGSCNNLAVELRTGRRGDADRDALMLAVASASRDLWASAGTWVNVERADYQLAHCHAVLGNADAAVKHARACLAALEDHAGAVEADAFERFFAHEAMAVALRSAGDLAAAGSHRQRMGTLMDRVIDADLAAWCREAVSAYDAVPA